MRWSLIRAVMGLSSTVMLIMRLALLASLPAVLALTFRVAGPGDLRNVAKLRVKVFSPHLTSTYSLYQQEKQYAEAAAKKTRVIIAEDEGKLVGAADMMLHRNGPGAGEASCYVSGVSVDPERRRRGIGRSLMAEVETGLAELQADLLTLHVEESNEAAVGLYNDVGFETAPEDSAVAQQFAEYLPDDPDEPAQVFMSKRISEAKLVPRGHAASKPMDRVDRVEPMPEATSARVEEAKPDPRDASPDVELEPVDRSQLHRKITFRVAGPDDFRKVAKLRVKVFSPHLTSTYSLYQQEKQYAEAAAKKTRVIIAEDEGKLVGAADMMLHRNGPGAGEASCYVSGVSVDPERRRRGIGRSLMAEVEAALAELQADLLTLHVEESNEAAVGLYNDVGFETAPEDSAVAQQFAEYLPDDPDEPAQVFMSKRISEAKLVPRGHAASKPIDRVDRVEPMPEATSARVEEAKPDPRDASPDVELEPVDRSQLHRKITFRVAGPDDFRKVAKLRVKVFAPHLMSDPTSLQHREKQYEEAAAQKTCVVIAEVGGRVVGAADMMFIFPPTEAGEKSCYVSDVSVDPETRGMGIGLELMDVMEAGVAQTQASLIALHVAESNEVGLCFCSKAGFKAAPDESAEALRFVEYMPAHSEAQVFMSKSINVGTPDPRERSTSDEEYAEVERKFRFRLASPADLRAVARLRVKVFSPHLTSTYSLYQQEKLYMEAAAQKTCVVIAEDEGGVVGATDMMLLFPSLELGEASCYVSGMCVDPQRRGMGIEQRLMAVVEAGVAEIAEFLALHVEEGNEPGLSFYSELGFEAVPDNSPVALRFAEYRPNTPGEGVPVLVSKKTNEAPPRDPSPSDAPREQSPRTGASRRTSGVVMCLAPGEMRVKELKAELDKLGVPWRGVCFEKEDLVNLLNKARLNPPPPPPSPHPSPSPSVDAASRAREAPARNGQFGGFGSAVAQAEAEAAEVNAMSIEDIKKELAAFGVDVATIGQDKASLVGELLNARAFSRPQFDSSSLDKWT